MRKIVLAATFAASLSLAGCSEGTQQADGADETAGAAEGEGAEAVTSEAATRLDANSATAEQLAGVSGLSPEVAEAVVAGRPYATVVEFNAKLRETLSAEEAAAVLTGVFVPVNLNTASEEEIKLIPGMSERMVHEFLEYRPYEDMAEFDREIGKYVDEAEVARLRSYVTL